MSRDETYKYYPSFFRHWRRYIAEILPIRCKTLCNQLINRAFETTVAPAKIFTTWGCHMRETKICLMWLSVLKILLGRGVSWIVFAYSHEFSCYTYFKRYRWFSDCTQIKPISVNLPDPSPIMVTSSYAFVFVCGEKFSIRVKYSRQGRYTPKKPNPLHLRIFFSIANCRNL